MAMQARPRRPTDFGGEEAALVSVGGGEFLCSDVAAPEQLVVTRSINPDDLRQLLGQLTREDCVHSWKNFGSDGTLEALLRWENNLRPTEIFFFYLKRDDLMRMVAVGAVADRLMHGFPHPGFCVLGRCYIIPEFRGRGLYRRVLHYRLEYCRERFGTALSAVHLGSDSNWIARVVANHQLPGWPRFIHLGQEQLTVAGKAKLVDAYLMLLPEYLEKIRRALAGPRPPTCVVDLRHALAATEWDDVRNVGAAVRDGFERARAYGWFDQRDAREIEQLLTFCRSVPLVGFG
jgi:GNAT superfamily N-acetyltransferase